MRIEAEVKKVGTTESGMSIKDREGKYYHWITKAFNHDLWFTDDFIKVKMTIVHEDRYGITVKNIRVIS